MEHILVLSRIAEMERERYSSSGDYSITEIIDPPRLVRLRKRYGSEIVASVCCSTLYDGYCYARVL